MAPAVDELLFFTLFQLSCGDAKEESYSIQAVYSLVDLKLAACSLEIFITLFDLYPSILNAIIIFPIG